MHLPTRLVVQLCSPSGPSTALGDLVVTLHVMQKRTIRHLLVLGRSDAQGRLVVDRSELERHFAAEPPERLTALIALLEAPDPQVECALVGGRSFGRILPMLQAPDQPATSAVLSGARNALFETETRPCPWSADAIEVELPAVPLGGLTADKFVAHQRSVRGALLATIVLAGLARFGGPAQLRYARVTIWFALALLYYLLWWQFRNRKAIAALRRFPLVRS